MTTFVIIRHGLSVTNKGSRFTGQLDVPLAEEGVIQAKETGRYIKENFKIDSVYSSDLCRAVETARPAAEAFGLSIKKRADLRELNVGLWQGRTLSDIEKEEPEAYGRWIRDISSFGFPGGESHKDMAIRAKKAFDEMAGENEGKTVLVATHGGLIRNILCTFTDKGIKGIKDTPRLLNASVTVMKYDKGKVEFVSVGKTDHLTESADNIKGE
ncbi:MAG: histidine phosphatase family protein [Clostridia bacterium]|nr:histidine phosphatase family protein [Clostridia bacterium]